MKETGRNGFQQKVIEQLEKQTALIFNIHGHRMQKSGWPDLQIIHRRWKGFLELKCEKYEASALQRIVAAKIELRGTSVYVLRCVEHKYLNPELYNALADPLFNYYTLENFQGDIIKTFDDLRSLLDVLVGLEKKEKLNFNCKDKL